MTKQETYELLTRAGIQYEITEHQAVFNMKELEEIEQPYPDCDAKNLFVRDDKKKNYYLITVKGDRRVDLKEFRKTHLLRNLSFASAEELMNILKLIPGAVTPLGLLNDEERKVTLYLDAALAGGLVGFLVYNFNPAKVFMGDTGSLFLGGAIAALAFAYDMPLILISVGIVYILETLSDIIQVGYFKLTKKLKGEGRRIFRMAPLHHHLEMGGCTGKKWKEKELFCLYTGISLVAAIISFLWVYRRF